MQKIIKVCEKLKLGKIEKIFKYNKKIYRNKKVKNLYYKMKKHNLNIRNF